MLYLKSICYFHFLISQIILYWNPKIKLSKLAFQGCSFKLILHYELKFLWLLFSLFIKIEVILNICFSRTKQLNYEYLQELLIPINLSLEFSFLNYLFLLINILFVIIITPQSIHYLISLNPMIFAIKSVLLLNCVFLMFIALISIKHWLETFV